MYFENAHFLTLKQTNNVREYKNPAESHFMELPKAFRGKIKSIIDEIKQAISNWEQMAKLCAISKDSIQLISKTSATLLRN